MALIALDRNKGNIHLTAKTLGIATSTLFRWDKARREGRLVMPPPELPELPEKATLADRLEQIVQRMVAVMPEKVEEASLQELTRSLTTILATMNQARAQAGDSQEDIELYERLVRHMAQFAPDGAADSDVPHDAPAQAD
jgi:transposase-like protein